MICCNWKLDVVYLQDATCANEQSDAVFDSVLLPGNFILHFNT